MVYTYYNVGQYIVEEEQQGEQRAAYGKSVLKELSRRLTERFGEGWSVENLTLCRKFYLTYSVNTVYDKTNSKHRLRISETLDTVAQIEVSTKVMHRVVFPENPFTLSWSHYLILMRIADPMARNFYEIECKQQDWSVRQLSRQVNSSLLKNQP